MRVFTGNGGGGGVSLWMDLDAYPVRVDRDNNVYVFWSDGTRGLICKVVVYSKIRNKTYNLGFGDWDHFRNYINDRARSNNDDMDKVLATVVNTIVDFLENNPGSIIDIEGSTPSRTRLYQMKIAQYMDEFSHVFQVKGWYNNKWEQFVPGKNYKRLRLKER